MDENRINPLPMGGYGNSSSILDAAASRSTADTTSDRFASPASNAYTLPPIGASSLTLLQRVAYSITPMSPEDSAFLQTVHEGTDDRLRRIVNAMGVHFNAKSVVDTFYEIYFATD